LKKGLKAMRTQAIAAAMIVALVTTAEGHSWYQKNAATTRTVIRSRAKKLKKSATAGSGATRQPNKATGFRTIDCTHRRITLVTFAFRHRRSLAAFVFMFRCQHDACQEVDF